MTWTALFFTGVIIYYFTSRYLDKTEPSVQYTRYHSDQFYQGDLVDNNFHFYWVPWTTDNGSTISFEDFNKSFRLQGSISTYSFEQDPDDPTAQLNPERKDGKILEFVPCAQADWVKREEEAF
jgi:hypothetical protein